MRISINPAFVFQFFNDKKEEFIQSIVPFNFSILCKPNTKSKLIFGENSMDHLTQVKASHEYLP